MSDLQKPKSSLSELRIEGLEKRVGSSFTLRADFKIAPGERVALVGRSGSGKTTLLRTIAGLEPFQQVTGKIFLGLEEITRDAPQDRQVGFVFQEAALFPSLSVLENTTFGLKVRGVSKKEREKAGLEWLEKVGLHSQADRSVGKLSGGERQRIAFIRALIFKPRLLLLDEPFSAQDDQLRSVLRQELIQLHDFWPAPLLFVTHEKSDLTTVATRCLEIYEEPASDVRVVRVRSG